MVNAENPKSVKSIKGMLFRLTAGNLSYLAAQFLAFVALAQWTSLTEVGRFSWALALTSPVFLFADMRTSQIQLSTTAVETGYRTFLFQRCLMQLIAAPFAVIFGFIFAPDSQTQNLVVGLAVLKFIEGFINISIAEHMRSEDSGIVAIIQIVRGILYAGAFGSAVWFSGSASIAVWSTAAALLAPVLLGYYSLPKSTRTKKTNLRSAWILTRESWTIGLGFFLGSLTVNAPRFLVEEFHGVESLGVYSAVAYVIVLANTVVDSVTQGLMPRYSAYWKRGAGRRALSGTFKICMLVGGIGITALITSYFTGDFILETVYGEDFTQGRMILVALFAYATIQYISSALRSVLIAGGLRGGVFWISLLNLSVTMIFAISWVPEGGAESAGWALAIGQIAQVSVYLWIAFSKLRGYDTRATPPT
jgi:O-antigen/teichoic acid export membrane protein